MSLGKDIDAVVDSIRPFLVGRDTGLQGAVLCELVAMHLAGHMGPDAAKVRKMLLKLHVETVRRLIPIHEERILKHIRRRAH